MVSWASCALARRNHRDAETQSKTRTHRLSGMMHTTTSTEIVSNNTVYYNVLESNTSFMITKTKTLRLREPLRSEIDRIAKRSRRSFSEVTQDLIEEALRMRKCAGIYFADERAGREAKITGTGLGVWEIIGVYKAVSKKESALRRRFPWLTQAQIRASLDYYRTYPDEVDALIDENEIVYPHISKA